MEKEIILIIGLPGSGKTEYARTLNIPVIDDPEVNYPTQREMLIRVKELLSDNLKICITTPSLCNTYIRKGAEKLLTKKTKAKISFIFFANDPEQCRINVAARNDGRKVEEYISRLTETYNPPQVDREVYRNEN